MNSIIGGTLRKLFLFVPIFLIYIMFRMVWYGIETIARKRATHAGGEHLEGAVAPKERATQKNARFKIHLHEASKKSFSTQAQKG